MLCLSSLSVALRSRMQNNEINQDELAPGGNPEALGSASKLFVEAVSPSMRAVEAVIRELSGRELAVLLVAEPGAGSMPPRGWFMKCHPGEPKVFKPSAV